MCTGVINICPGLCTNVQLKSKEKGDHTSAGGLALDRGGIQGTQSSQGASSVPHLQQRKGEGRGSQASFTPHAHSDLAMLCVI